MKIFPKPNHLQKVCYCFLAFFLLLQIGFFSPFSAVLATDDNSDLIGIQDGYGDNSDLIAIQDNNYPADNSDLIAIQEDNYPSDNSDLIAIQDNSIPSDCPTDRSDQYPQCGGTVGLESENPANTFMVTRVKDCRGNIIGYEKENLGNLGQCQRSTSVGQSCTEKRRDYPQCGGTVGLENFPGTDTIMVAEFTNSCTGAKRYQVVSNLGNLNQCQRSVPAPVPTQSFQPAQNVVFRPVITQQPVVTCQETRNQFRVCGGTASAPGFPSSHTILMNEVINSCSGRSIEIVDDEGDRGQCVTSAINPPSTMITPIPQGTAISCPQGTIQSLSGSSVVCLAISQNQDQQQSATGGTAVSNSYSSATGGSVNVTLANNTNPAPIPQTVLVKSSEQLPKTGLPMLAWTLSGLVPLGAGLKRFSRGVKSNTDAPQYLWQQREFLKD